MNPWYKPHPVGTNPLVQTGFVPGMNRGNGLREVYTSLARTDETHTSKYWIL